MQDNTSDPLDVDKRRMCNELYDMSHPPDDVRLNQLDEQTRTSSKSKQIKRMAILKNQKNQQVY